MPFEPVSPLGGFTGLDEAPEQQQAQPAPTTSDAWEAAYRTENTVVSSVISQARRFSGSKVDPDFDPWAEIAGTPYEPYTDQFAAATNKQHADAIKADIDRESKDRDTISRSGLTGFGASMAAGIFDWPSFLPGGTIIRNANGGVSLLKSTASVAAAGTVGAAASETVLQGTQQLRTGEESAMVIGGSTVLAGLLGAGFGKLFSRAEQAAFAARVEKDFTIPGHGEPDHYTPGGVQVDAVPGASPKAASVADIIRQTAEEILPPQVRVQVADEIGLPKTGADADGRFSLRDTPAIDTPEFKNWFGESKVVDDGGTPLRVYHGTDADFEAFDPSKTDGVIFFTNSAEYASRHAKRPGGNVVEAYLRIERPAPNYQAFLNDAVNRYDGYIGGEDFMVKSPTQIKSSIGNRGTFDPNDPRIAFGVRKEGPATIAEGRFDSEKLLITISADALDPVKTLKHESIHALRTMNLFTDKEWGTLEAAARKQGWVESNNVRALYEELYSGKASDEQFSLAAKTNKEPITLKAIRADDMPEGMRSFEIHQPGEMQPGFINGNVNPRNPKDLVIASIAMPGSSNSLGDANVREMLRQIKKAYPEFETISGTRLTGARQRADQPLDHAYASLRLPRAAEDTKFSVRGEGDASTGPLDPKLENLLIEEAIAEQFSLWRQGAIQVTGTVAKLFQRIKDFLDRIGNALRGQGFQTADDVFASVRGGDVAGRAAPTVAPGLPGGAALASGMGRSVGAAAREAVDNTLKPALGLETVRVDPLIYLQNSKSEKARTYIQELAETPLAYKKNAKGYETAPLGSEMGEPGAVESRIKMWQAPLADSVKYLDNAFMQYRKGRDAQMFDQMRTTVGDALAKPEKLTWRQFKEEVAKSARRGDTHEIPEVAQAAKFARQSVFNPLKERAIAKELLPEDISAETAESYLNRMYNKEKIIARRPEFKGIVEKWLDEVEFRNGVTRAQLSPLLKRLDKLQEAAKKEAAKPKTASTRAEAAEAITATDRPKIDLDIAEAYRKVQAGNPNDKWVYLSDLRDNLSYSREEVDAALKRLWLEGADQERRTVDLSIQDDQGRLTESNRAAATNFGASRQDLISISHDSPVLEAGKPKATKAEAAAEKAAADKAEMTELQEQIEALVLRYEGKTKAEAESAVKAREKAEVGRDPAAKRLRAADKPIIRAARKIAAQVDKEAGETASLADEIIDRVLGTPDGRLPYDAHLNRTTDAQGVSSSARGPLAARTFMIPDALIEDFLENDFEMLMHAYVRTMAPDIELHARFGDVDMKLQMKEIQEDWAKKASAATSEKERKSLHAQRNGDIKRLAAIRDRLRGTYALPSDPDGLLLRTGRVMRSGNYVAMLGGQVASAIPDMGSIVFSHGIMRTFGDGIIPLFRNFSGARMAMGEVKLAGTALDMVLDSRAMNIGEIMDDYGRHSKFERGVQSLTRNFGPVSLMSPWNAAMKQTAGLITMSRIIRAADALKRDVIKKPDLERLAASGISRDNAIKIAEQFKKHGEKDGGVYLPKTENWDADARAAKEAFRGALVREVDKTIITPGQEKWLWMSTELGKTLGQFKSFSVSANQRLLIAGLQQRDMGTLSGAALMVALGGLVHILKTKAGGRDPGIDWSDNEKTSQFMVNAVDRSGLLGWLMEANAISEKVTGGQVGLSKLTGRPISRYASRNLVGAMAGPTFGTLQSIGQVSSAGFTDWKETDTRAARRLIPYQNLFYMRSLFDKAEEGVNSYFGVPKTATRR